MEEFKIEDGVLVKYLGNNVNVVVPDGVTSISATAFEYCPFIERITIPDSIASIGYDAFEDCYNLTDVYIKLSSFENFLKMNDNYTLHVNIHLLDQNNNELADIKIPNGITKIGRSAFIRCKSITSISIPDSVASIGDYAFCECESLKSIVVDKDNKVFDSRDNCNAIIETKSNKIIASCSSTIIPNSVSTIGKAAFSGSSFLIDFTIPNNIKIIEEDAFYGCDSLESVVIPEGVISIGQNAFCGCTRLTSITIPSSVRNIGDYAFSDCLSLKRIVVDKDNKVFDIQYKCVLQ